MLKALWREKQICLLSFPGFPLKCSSVLLPSELHDFVITSYPCFPLPSFLSSNIQHAENCGCCDMLLCLCVIWSCLGKCIIMCAWRASLESPEGALKSKKRSLYEGEVRREDAEWGKLTRDREFGRKKCHKHLFSYDAIAPGLQLNVAGALRVYEMDQALHLEAVHGGQVQTRWMQTWTKGHIFQRSHQRRRRALPPDTLLIRSEEIPLCNLDTRHATMRLHTEIKCDTTVTWRRASDSRSALLSPMPERRLPHTLSWSERAWVSRAAMVPRRFSPCLCEQSRADMLGGLWRWVEEIILYTRNAKAQLYFRQL